MDQGGTGGVFVDLNMVIAPTWHYVTGGSILASPAVPFSSFNTPRPGTCGDRRELDFLPPVRNPCVVEHSRPQETPSKLFLDSNETFCSSEVLEGSEAGARDGAKAEDTEVEAAKMDINTNADARLGVHGRQDPGRGAAAKIPVFQDRCDDETNTLVHGRLDASKIFARRHTSTVGVWKVGLEELMMKMSSRRRGAKEVSSWETPAGIAPMPLLKGETLAPWQICLFRFSRNGATRRRSTEGYGRDELRCFFIGKGKRWPRSQFAKFAISGTAQIGIARSKAAVERRMLRQIFLKKFMEVRVVNPRWRCVWYIPAVQCVW